MRESRAGMPMWSMVAIVGMVMVVSGGCGQVSGTGGAGGTGGKASVANNERKSITRDEAKKIRNTTNSPEKLQEKLGKPDKTYEENKATTVNGGLGQVYNIQVVEYNRLTIDASGSGKTDAVTVFRFGDPVSHIVFLP